MPFLREVKLLQISNPPEFNTPITLVLDKLLTLETYLEGCSLALIEGGAF